MKTSYFRADELLAAERAKRTFRHYNNLAILAFIFVVTHGLVLTVFSHVGNGGGMGFSALLVIAGLITFLFAQFKIISISHEAFRAWDGLCFSAERHSGKTRSEALNMRIVGSEPKPQVEGETFGLNSKVTGSCREI